MRGRQGFRSIAQGCLVRAVRVRTLDTMRCCWFEIPFSCVQTRSWQQCHLRLHSHHPAAMVLQLESMSRPSRLVGSHQCLAQ